MLGFQTLKCSNTGSKIIQTCFEMCPAYMGRCNAFEEVCNIVLSGTGTERRTVILELLQ